MKKSFSTWEDYPVIEIEQELSAKENPSILAFSCYFHDSSACIVKDGKLIAAADEERFSRKKHDPGFPKQAISYCLEAAKLNAVDLVAFYENPDVKWKRIEETLITNPPSPTICSHIERIWQEIKSKENIQEVFTRETNLKNRIIFLDHHLCHAASSYYMSGFNESAVVTIDGVGEKATTSFGTAKDNTLSISKCINFPHSIGLLYTAITVFLGFKANDHEYKIMGLAAYGMMDRNNNPYYERLRNVIELYEDGSFELDMRYFGHNSFHLPACTEAMCDLLKISQNKRESAITQEHMNLAAALQMVTEDAVFNVLNYVHNLTGHEQLCFAGGVALNSVLNGKILSQTKFKRLFIQPSAGDSGSVIGAAKYIQHRVDSEAVCERMLHSSYGTEYSSEVIRQFLEENQIIYREFFSDDELLDKTAKLLQEKNVVGWFQGRMEWGPRSLGNRSILASPLYDDMRDILNIKVKHREVFRPFAPVICVDDALTFFDCDDPIPEPTDYMLMVYPISQKQQSKIPAVTHVDGSGRLQTIRQNQNPLYYKLIKKFGALTEVPILVNTSFNIRGEPIVCSPQDAYRCMMGTQIDYLIIGHFVIKRMDNLRDAWFPTVND
ncbi:MAG: hypothetical protein DSM106950_23590 [Stigonema ocellatum SAG 48.90 = DSM 106950]|nr:hypothetical protein [Stigonema ocellatum SAG 48.90 = DSM 106950]